MSNGLNICQSLFVALAGVNHKLENKSLHEKKYLKNENNEFVSFVNSVIKKEQMRLFDKGCAEIMSKEQWLVSELQDLHRSIYGY